MPWGRTILPFAITVAAAVAIIVLSSAKSAPVPAVASGAKDPDRIVAVLQIDQKTYPPELRRALQRHRATPDNPAFATDAARALIAQGRANGDSRLVGAALGVLRPLLQQPTPEILYLAATARQYQHDFPGSLALLDQAIALAPRDLNARLTRATVHIVLGEFPAAEADCAALSAASRPDLGFLCSATAQTLTADAPGIYQRLKDITNRPNLLDPGLRGWVISLMGEIALRQGDAAMATAHLSEVIAADPLAIRERLLLADLHLQTGQPDAAIAVLQTAPDTDAVLIRRVMALEALGKGGDAKAFKADLAARFQLNLDLGLTAHAREETLYFLHIVKDPAKALARAKVNWALQHEFEDAELLIDAAIAADQPGAADPVLAWMRALSISVPTLHMPDEMTKASK